MVIATLIGGGRALCVARTRVVARPMLFVFCGSCCHRRDGSDTLLTPSTPLCVIVVLCVSLCVWRRVRMCAKFPPVYWLWARGMRASQSESRFCRILIQKGQRGLLTNEFISAQRNVITRHAGAAALSLCATPHTQANSVYVEAWSFCAINIIPVVKVLLIWIIYTTLSLCVVNTRVPWLYLVKNYTLNLKKIVWFFWDF